MWKSNILLLLVVFFLGMIVGVFFFNLNQGISGFVIKQNELSSDIQSPKSVFNESDFILHEDEIIIKIQNASISSYEDTDSMLPLIDNDSHGIRIKPQSPDQINVGDLVTFNLTGRMIIHRVIKKGTDKNGIYFITKGDNSRLTDEKIRFSDVYYKTVGILY